MNVEQEVIQEREFASNHEGRTALSKKTRPLQYDAWHSQAVAEVVETLSSSPKGLTSDESQERLAIYGPNCLKAHRKTSAWMRLLLQFHNPLVYVLLATACVTGALQHWVDTAVILGVVVVNAIIGYIQESKAEKAIESLKQLLAPAAIALRDGRKTNVSASELVLGDVVCLQGGDKVPADLRLAQQKNLQVDEAPLTGESMRVEKIVERLAENVLLADRRNMAFAGTLVSTGTATGMVVATGENTQIGRIADMLSDVEGVQTPFIKRLAYFSKVISVVIIVSCVFIFLLGVLLGQAPLQMLMAVVALAVSAIPEGLPAIMTIALAIGVKRMATRNVVIRKLPAVETLGSATVICTDKTGTLTRNEMTVTQIATPAGRFSVTGTGYIPTGNILDEQGTNFVSNEEASLGELIRASALCNDAALLQSDKQWKINGDPTEGALIVLAEKAGTSVDALASSWPRTDEIPFESELQYMATMHHNHSGNAVIYAKGSPEKIVSFCKSEMGAEEPIDPECWHDRAAHMAEQGLRVLALAEKQTESIQTVLGYQDMEHGFELIGLVGMIDPPREEAIEAVQKCHIAGIQAKMITGDHVATAKSIASQIGILDADRALSGSDLDSIDDSSFDRAAASVNVFARVSPAHKLRLVQSLQRQGQVVAMTGDGVNDAPALKQADIGVAMGITGTDVSREAAEIVLLDDNFASIERAVEEGRTVFNNLKKTILFILPTNGGECLTLVAALLLGVMLPILPLHILWINLVTTVALAITLAFDPVDIDTMARPPRDPKAALIDRHLVWRVVYVSILMAAGTFGLFFYERALNSSLEVARAVAVNAIVFFEVAYLLNSRHLSESILNKRGILGNRIVWWGITAVVVFQLAFTYSPMMNTLFQVAPLDQWMWVRVLGAALILLLIVEAEKAVTRRCAAPNHRHSKQE